MGVQDVTSSARYAREKLTTDIYASGGDLLVTYTYIHTYIHIIKI